MHIKTSNQEELAMGIGNYTCNWGLHICGLYETEKERDDFIFGLLCKGFEENDLQLYCPSERTHEDFKHKFSEECPHCSKEDFNDKNKIELFTTKEFYYPSGIFSPLDMKKSLNEFYSNSQKKGKRNIRATAEMVWALEAIPGVEDLMIYESLLNTFVEGKPWVSLCMYNINKFDGKTIINVLKTHPYTVNNGVITQNPMYQTPEKWLKENAPEFLEKLYS
jgi:hypothetical protein